MVAHMLMRQGNAIEADDLLAERAAHESTLTLRLPLQARAGASEVALRTVQRPGSATATLTVSP